MEHHTQVFTFAVLTIVLIALAPSLGLCVVFSPFVVWPSCDDLLADTDRVVRAVAGVLGHPLPQRRSGLGRAAMPAWAARCLTSACW